MSRPSVVVIGDVVLDRDIVGRADRLSPDAPVPVVDIDGVRERPGAAGLAAQLCATGAVDVTLAAPIASDPAGRRLAAMLSSDLSLVPMSHDGPTRHKTRVLARGQVVVRFDEGGPGQPVDPPVDVLRHVLRAADAVLVSDYGAGTTRHPAIRNVLAAVAPRVPTVWDPHPRGGDPVPGVIATPNLAEAAEAASRAGLDVEADAGALAAALCELWRANAVCVTAGAAGAHLAVAPDETVALPAPWPASGDTCGAGDRFVSAVVKAMAEGAGLPEAAASGVAEATAWVAAGGVNAHVERPAPPVGLGEPGRAEKSHRAASNGLLPFDAPSGGVHSNGAGSTGAEAVAAVRARGGTVVATGGCFDIVHAGHVSCLEAARRMGDALVVLINSDASVRRLKGPGRPVMTAAERARVLLALSCVDAVEVFDEDDPRAALDRLRPDIWVKGADYSGKPIPEAPLVEGWGGRVALVPYLDGHSTTSILRRSAGSRAWNLTEASWTA
ncbi:MAG TPA: PfkB family carbohydrate kinase [Jiangellales bacterium]|nr:PfkB family carbohydrate kinase [Jiangellales bacterium]